MAELNEEQLLLLDNLMYYSGSSDKENTSVEEIAKKLLRETINYDKSSLNLSGGFEDNPQRAQEIALAILKDQSLCDLTIADYREETGFRATCFVDGDNEATVAVRGTGGSYEAWKDNIIGAYSHNTQISQYMQDFIDGLDYDNITITGHSKGGNLAQYATIMNGDKIDRCVSFDGQGFNKEFIENHQSEIAANSSKIKSICAEGDYVNILLNSIAGETVYLNSTWGEDPHSSYTLWKENAGKMENGEFNKTAWQNWYIVGADELMDSLINDGVNQLPDEVEHSLVDWLGSKVGIMFAKKTGQYNNKYEQMETAEYEVLLDELYEIVEPYVKEANNFKEKLKQKYIDVMSRIKTYEAKAKAIAVGAVGRAKNAFVTAASMNACVASVSKGGRLIPQSGIGEKGFEIDIIKVKGQMEGLEKAVSQLENIMNRLESIKLMGSQYGEVLQMIKTIREQVENEKKSLTNMEEVLGNCCELYTYTEANIMAAC